MIILGIETSTEACSVAIATSDRNIVSRFDLAPRQHTELLPIQLSAVLDEAGIERSHLTHIAFANGPGAFTGVRIAASFAQGLALALNIPLVPISSLAVLAQYVCEQRSLNSADALLDARMGELYFGRYVFCKDSGVVKLKGQEALIKQQDYKLEPGVIAAGGGWDALIESGQIESTLVDSLSGQYPHAAALVKLAEIAIQAGAIYPPDQVDINYIRNRVAEKKRLPDQS